MHPNVSMKASLHPGALAELYVLNTAASATGSLATPAAVGLLVELTAALLSTTGHGGLHHLRWPEGSPTYSESADLAKCEQEGGV